MDGLSLAFLLRLSPLYGVSDKEERHDGAAGLGNGKRRCKAVRPEEVIQYKHERDVEHQLAHD